ncbi:unnamed protein product [Cylicostephanus goldi]|uniref:Uncharacterized protein n=1 Tax=Cylicostephanus goldi TaxID=71465 RepID=A0A3P6S9Y8_CYLGO|nr:unnamed protein product [Cylicostephanus goldi]
MEFILLSLIIASLFTDPSLLFIIEIAQSDAVRGALVLKKSHQQSMDSDDNIEELEDFEEEHIRNELDRAGIFEQGETRDFLQFLKMIRYDHRQCPEDENGGPVFVNVSIVVSNIRSVSEVTMVGNNI